MSTAIQVPVHKQIFSIVIWSMTYLFVFLLIKDWSKSTGGGGGGPEHFEMRWLENTWPTPSNWSKTEWPTPKWRLKITWLTPL